LKKKQTEGNALNLAQGFDAEEALKKLHQRFINENLL
jgi:hypothetical protein